jgi:hypothetical protein
MPLERLPRLSRCEQIDCSNGEKPEMSSPIMSGMSER